MGTKVIVNSSSPNRVSINNQQRETIRTVAVSPASAAEALVLAAQALAIANSAYDKANNAVLRTGDTMTGNLSLSSNSVFVFSDGSRQNTAFNNIVDGGTF